VKDYIWGVSYFRGGAPQERGRRAVCAQRIWRVEVLAEEPLRGWSPYNAQISGGDGILPPCSVSCLADTLLDPCSALQRHR
jgi:hypothetical protein